MFTGIIQEIGTVAKVERRNGLVRLSIHAPRTASRVQLLESVAVNGVCLSVVGIRQPVMTFEVIRETLHLTSLGALRKGEQVNLEPSLSMLDRLSGHLLFGHVDGMGTILKRRQRVGELVLEVRVPVQMKRFIVSKAPVAVDGVSLTVGERLTASTFTVHLIPETLRQTILRARMVGDRVNVELDYFAKLIWQFLKARRVAEDSSS